MIDNDLLKILCCPETHQELRVAESTLVEKLNQQITAGSLKNRAGQPVKKPIDGGLLRADGKFLYLIRHAIAVPHGTRGVAEDDRYLTEEGIEKMKKGAAGLRALGVKPDLILTSPLARARQTGKTSRKKRNNGASSSKSPLAIMGKYGNRPTMLY